MDIQRSKLQLLTASCREAVVCGWFNHTSCDRGAGFGGTFLFAPPPPPPPELHETGTIRKHWNRATIYAETERVPEQLSEIRALECGLKNCKNAKTSFATW